MQTIHFLATITSALTAPLCKPFLLPSIGKTRMTTDEDGEILIMQNHSHIWTNSQGLVYQQNYTLTNNTDTHVDTVTPDDVEIQIPFLIVGCLLWLLSIYSFVLFSNGGGMLIERSIKLSHGHTEYTFKSLTSKFQGLFLFFFIIFMVGGIEDTFGGILQTFTVNFLGWTQSTGTVLILLFWLGQGIGRGIGIIQAKYCSPPAILLAGSLILLLSMIIMVIGLHHSHLVVWVCTTTAGIGLATGIPSTVSWLGSTIGATGINTAIIFFGKYLGTMITPTLVANLFEEVGPNWFMNIMLIYSCCMLLFVILTKLLVVYNERKSTYHSTTHQEQVQDIQASKVLMSEYKTSINQL